MNHRLNRRDRTVWFYRCCSFPNQQMVKCSKYVVEHNLDRTITLYGDGLLQVVSMPADDLATHAECSPAMS